ncbi:uncharacterized protein LOC100206861 isoform X1 [Hydra vulgaris]|uniref:uncharacterized protein LOC100206861 isoform X1 n=1 Tax=Hydra vulgaris TaxID=6087 RepID=UPI001F5E9A12|nr:uncharacterized protein LOC100206861 isoform X1 [Hydra vulgaris]
MMSIGIKVLIGYVLILPHCFLSANLTASNIHLTSEPKSPQTQLKTLSFSTKFIKLEKNTKSETRKTTQFKPKPKSEKPKKTKTTLPPIKEFRLQALLEIGLKSNEANKFIRSRSILGKPLEEQYEITRESDMNYIETKHAKDDGESRESMKAWRMNKI